MKASHKRKLLLGLLLWKGGMAVNRTYCLLTGRCKTLQQMIEKGEVVVERHHAGGGANHTIIQPVGKRTDNPPSCPECQNRITSYWDLKEHKQWCSYHLDPISNYDGNYRTINKALVPSLYEQRHMQRRRK